MLIYCHQHISIMISNTVIGLSVDNLRFMFCTLCKTYGFQFIQYSDFHWDLSIVSALFFNTSVLFIKFIQILCAIQGFHVSNNKLSSDTIYFMFSCLYSCHAYYEPEIDVPVDHMVFCRGKCSPLIICMSR